MASEPPKTPEPPKVNTAPVRHISTRLVKCARVTRKGTLVWYTEERVLFDNGTLCLKEHVSEAHFKKLRSSLVLGGAATESRLVSPENPPKDSGSSFPTRTVLPPRGAPSRYSARVAAQPTLPEVEAPPPAKVVSNLGTVIQVQSPEGVLVTKAIRTVLEMEGGREQIKEVLKKPDVIAGAQLRRAMRIRRA